MFLKGHVFSEKKQPPAGLHHTEVRIGDAPKPYLLMKSHKQKQKINPLTGGQKIVI